MRWLLVCIFPGMFHKKLEHTAPNGDEMVIITTHYGRVVKVRKTIKTMIKHFFDNSRHTDDNNDNN